LRPLGNTLYLLPPFCITDAQLDRAYAGIKEGLECGFGNQVSSDFPIGKN